MTAVEFYRPVAVERIGPFGFERDIEATAEECAALAARFAIPAVHSLVCRFKLRRGHDEDRAEILAEADLEASLRLVCVVTLDEFDAPFREQVTLRFVSAGTERDDHDSEEVDEIPYSGGEIDLGEAAAEQIALDLDPYPRKPGAALPDEAQDADLSPFAALRTRLVEK